MALFIKDHYKAKGLMTFKLGTEGVEVDKVTKDDLRKQYSEMTTLEELLNTLVEEKLMTCQYDLIEGHKFLDYVESHRITDYDGVISDVFVDGFISNIGLSHGTFSQGGFLLSPEVWREYCDKHEILVNWANK